MKLLQTIELSPLATRAAVSSVDKAARTVDLIFSTGAAVDRIDAYGRYSEKLSMDRKHVRLDRLNAGAPLLNSHSAYSISDVIGTVEPGSARIVGGQGVATVRFSKRDDVEAIWQDVIDGIIGSVSVGYRVHRFQEEAAKAGGIPTRTAIDWEPFEVSLVSMPADAGAKVRGDAPAVELNRCEIWPAETDEPTPPVIEPTHETYRHQMTFNVADAGSMQVRWNDDGADINITTTLNRDLALRAALTAALRHVEELTGQIQSVRQQRNVKIRRLLRDLDSKQLAGCLEFDAVV